MPPSDPDSSIPDVASDQDLEDDEIFIEGGQPFGDMINALGLPPPIPQIDTSSSAPAASLVHQALTNAPTMPLVVGDPIFSKPKKVVFKKYLGCYDVFMLGEQGEHACFLLPMRRAAADRGYKGLMVVNLSSASVGTIDSISSVGPRRFPVLSTNVLVRGSPISSVHDIDLDIDRKSVV